MNYVMNYPLDRKDMQKLSLALKILTQNFYRMNPGDLNELGWDNCIPTQSELKERCREIIYYSFDALNDACAELKSNIDGLNSKLYLDY